MHLLDGNFIEIVPVTRKTGSGSRTARRVFARQDHVTRGIQHVAQPTRKRRNARLDAELNHLPRGAGRLRLRIRQALRRLGDGYRELGFSTLGAYSLKRCGRGGRWAAESRAPARRLEGLPGLSVALESGSVGWSMAELLARHATPQTEAALLELARDKTVQAMRLAPSAAAVQISGSPRDEAPNEPVQISGTAHGKVSLHLRVPGDRLPTTAASSGSIAKRCPAQASSTSSARASGAHGSPCSARRTGGQL